MIAALIARGLAPWAAKLIAHVGLPLLAAGGLWLAFTLHGAAQYRAGEKAERARIEKEAERLARKAVEVQRAADEVRRKAEALDRERITTERKEVDDALSKLPDQAPSDRQRARACIQLRRQAEAAGKPESAC